MTTVSGMTEATIRRLANLEYVFARLDADLTDLSRDLHMSAHDAPECSVAALGVTRLRQRLASLRELVEPAMAEAVGLLETLEPAPF